MKYNYQTYRRGLHYNNVLSILHFGDFVWNILDYFIRNETTETKL